MHTIYSIIKSDIENPVAAALELISSIPADRIPLRLVFFGKVHDNIGYIEIRKAIFSAIEKVFGNNRPMVTFVAQAPLDCKMALECCTAPKGTDVVFKFKDDIRYAVIEDDDRYLMTEGILPSSLDIPMREQADEVFRKLGAIMSDEKIAVNHIDRQWNYIEDIVGEKNPGLQNYQQLNDARSVFYSEVEWTDGYPAATGIGTQAGGIMVEIDAADLHVKRRVAIDNALQIAAHTYSTDVLVGTAQGKTTPKFERAKAIVSDDGTMIYVSGTAAIRGELSLDGVGIILQTKTTLENIEYLYSKDTLLSKDIFLQGELFVSNFRVYLKKADDYPVVEKTISECYPAVPAVYVLSDVCRDELLIEIECIVQN